MTDVAQGENREEPGLSATDEQLLRELTERARAGGLKLTGEGGLLGPRSLGEFLMKNGVNPKAVLACIETWCKTRLAGPTAQELAEREGTIAPPN